MSSYTEGQINQLANVLEEKGFTPDDVTKLGQYKELPAIRGLFHGTHEIKPVLHHWREEDGFIYFSVTSDGTTGKDWITRFESKGVRMSIYAEQMLCSPDFKPTSGITTEVAVLRGCLFEDDDRNTARIRAEADKRKLTKPNAELACLILEKFRKLEIEAMGLWWIVAMHEPINDSDGDPGLLCADRSSGGPWLGFCNGGPLGGWGRDIGFAFAVSQVSSQH